MMGEWAKILITKFKEHGVLEEIVNWMPVCVLLAVCDGIICKKASSPQKEQKLKKKIIAYTIRWFIIYILSHKYALKPIKHKFKVKNITLIKIDFLELISFDNVHVCEHMQNIKYYTIYMHNKIINYYLLFYMLYINIVYKIVFLIYKSNCQIIN